MHTMCPSPCPYVSYEHPCPDDMRHHLNVAKSARPPLPAALTVPGLGSAVFLSVLQFAAWDLLAEPPGSGGSAGFLQSEPSKARSGSTHCQWRRAYSSRCKPGSVTVASPYRYEVSICLWVCSWGVSACPCVSGCHEAPNKVKSGVC